MTYRTLDQCLQDDPTLKSKVRTYSCNFDLLLYEKRLITKEFSALFFKMMMKRSKFNLLKKDTDNTDTLMRSHVLIRQYYLNATSIIESLTSYYLVLLNPLSRYDYSHIRKKSRLDSSFHSQLINSDSTSYNPTRKMRVLTYIYINQLLREHPNNDDYPLVTNLTNPFNDKLSIQLTINSKIDKFRLENIKNLKETNPCDPNTLSIKINVADLFSVTLDQAFIILGLIVDIGNAMDHCSPNQSEIYVQNLKDQIVELWTKNPELASIMKEPYLHLKEGQYLSFFKEILHLSLNIDDDFKSRISKTLNESMANLKILGLDFLRLSTSYSLRSDLSDNDSVNNTEFIVKYFLSAFTVGFVFTQTLNTFQCMLTKIKPNLQDGDQIISPFAFKYLEQELDRDNGVQKNPTLFSYMNEIRNKRFKNEDSTIFDIVDFLNKKNHS